MLGKLRLPAYGGRHYTLMGGPYKDRPLWATGVKLAPELILPADITLNIPDFGVPDPRQLNVALWKVLLRMGRYESVYVGCGWGQGRTGLFLAALSKLWGIQHPVLFVRREYYPRAVETPGQFDYINELRFPLWLKAMMVTTKSRGWLPGEPSLTGI